MFRHLPILLIIFASTSAHAEPGFFEQLLNSLKSKTATTTSEPAGEPADSIASEPLALQPTTTTRRHNQKRSRASRRHSVSAPLRQPEALIGSPPASSKNTERSSAAEPAVPPELINNSKPVESILPLESQSNVLPLPTVWPNSAPAPIAPWPDESSRLESAQGDPPRGLQAEAQPKAEDDAQPDATEVAREVEPEPFLELATRRPGRFFRGLACTGDRDVCVSPPAGQSPQRPASAATPSRNAARRASRSYGHSQECGA